MGHGVGIWEDTIRCGFLAVLERAGDDFAIPQK